MSVDKNPNKIQLLFNEISSYYDIINNLISFGTHYFIKKYSIKLLKIHPNSNILDICCGTGDFTGIINKNFPSAKIIGLDFSQKMLQQAKKKYPSQTFIVGDCTNLPFKDNEFDYITVSFGLRNVENRKQALIEAYRVMKSGGKFLHLDFSGGKINFASKFFDFMVPIFIKVFNKNIKHYKYLLESKKTYPPTQTLIKEFENTGFYLIEKKSFVFGVISAQVFIKN